MIDKHSGTMSLKIKHYIEDNEADDDLERLRMAALKSVQSKKNSGKGKAIEVLGGSGLKSITPYANSDRFSKSKVIPEPYKPAVLSSISDRYVGPFATKSTNACLIPNVQLSPRSAAFVSQNNNILLRRQQGISRSPSPHSPYTRNKSPSRWSVTPPSGIQSKRTENISPLGGWSRRSGSLSRSPIPSGVRHRSRTRSPLPQLPPPPRRGGGGYGSRSTSPVSYNHANRRHSRSRSRTPNAFGPSSNGNRRTAGPQRRPSVHRYAVPVGKSNGRRSQTPPPQSVTVNSSNVRGRDHLSTQSRTATKRSASPRHSRSPDKQNSRPVLISNRHRTKSPLIVLPVKRTASGSPVRKIVRRNSRDRQLAARKRSPLNLMNRRNNNGRNNIRRNNDNKDRRYQGGNRRSTSPQRHRRSKSKSKQVGPNIKDDKNSTRIGKRKEERSRQDNDKRRNVTEKRKVDEKESRRKDENDVLSAASKKASPTKEDKKPTSSHQKTEEELVEDKLLKSSDDEDNSDSDDKESIGDDIEIDLFASEESESENEGRFKSSSSKNQRSSTVPTMSFSKLGSSSAAAIVRNLSDVSTTADKLGGNSRRDRDNRNNNAAADRRRRNNDSNRRGSNDNRNKKSSSNRRGGGGGDVVRERERNDRSENKTEKDSKAKEEKNSGGSLKMFKSTFQAIDNDPKPNEKSDEQDKGLASTAVQLKRSKITTKDDPKGSSTPTSSPPPRAQQASSQSTQSFSSVTSSIVVATTKATATHPSEMRTTTPPLKSLALADADTAAAAGSDVAGKKPIHLRLGAMTKTWKSPKKSWTSEKV